MLAEWDGNEASLIGRTKPPLGSGTFFGLAIKCQNCGGFTRLINYIILYIYTKNVDLTVNMGRGRKKPAKL